MLPFFWGVGGAVGGDLGEKTLINSLQNSLVSQACQKSQRSRSSGVGRRGGWPVSMVEARSFDGVPNGILPLPTFKFNSNSNSASPRIYEWGSSTRLPWRSSAPPHPCSWAGIRSLPSPIKAPDAHLHPKALCLGCHLGRSGFLLSSPKSIHLRPTPTPPHTLLLESLPAHLVAVTEEATALPAKRGRANKNPVCVPTAPELRALVAF